MDRKHTQHDAHAARNTYRGDGRNNTLERARKHHMSIDSTELPSSSDPSIEADNRKATPRHVGQDVSEQGTTARTFQPISGLIISIGFHPAHTIAESGERER